MNRVCINTDRFWTRLMQMAAIGATPKGGVCRVALTEEDRRGRDLFISWCEQAGCAISVDELGNIFARREGRDPALPAILLGSHLDSQPTGGKYDGALGVLAGLEVIDTLNDLGIKTPMAIEVVSWTNEEGARFAPAMLASGAYAGVFTREFAETRTDREGISLKSALEAIGYNGDRKLGEGNYAAFLELHIEQGPILEAENKTAGIVTGVQGIRWYDLEVVGKETHAGPSPMSFRIDPVRSVLTILQEIYALADAFGTDARVTIGEIKTIPGVRNTVPGNVKITIDLRHPVKEELDSMDRCLKEIVARAAKEHKAAFKLNEVWYSPPVAFSASCIDSLKKGAARLEIDTLEMVSGAGHDSVYLSKVMPAGMIFIPCRDGLSHNELEHIEKEHAEAGANLLLQGVLELAASAKISSV